ncbi:hypothetical protein [Aquimarina sp. Aq107]|uniref:hypothetical protein n=1 Tax=Aquimarina sp. Aq107 TaxID=1191912 RepID=UPI00131EF27E|nr:hypothetical protein [Aquimarina sp. Aq107]
MNSLMNTINRFELFLKSKKGLKIILLSIVLFNTGLYIKSNYSDYSSIQARRDASGFSSDKAYKFAYFYFYTDHFPLATLNKDLEYSEEGANKEITNRGKDLIMEYRHWSRLGESARILAYLPNAYLKGSPENPSIKLFNGLIFTIGLLLLFFGFWKIKKPLFGFLLCFLINCTPFFLFEVYSNENIFGLMASVFFMIIGLNIHVLFLKSIDYFRLGFIAIISGVILGFFSEFRNEISIVIVSLLLIYLLSKNIKIVPRIVLVITVVFFFNSSKKYIRNHFNLKFEKTSHFVSLNKGHVYNGAKISGHNFWHPMFCGLGDFDTKYGYEWNDIIAYNYAIPILNKKYNMNIRYSGKYQTDDYYDDAKLYYKKPEELPNYEEVVKEKVLTDIKNDPLWYTTIIVKRVFRTLTATIPIPYAGLLLFPLIYFLIKRKDWDWIKLIIVSLPLSATSIMVHSGRGTTYNSLFVYFVLVILFVHLCNYFKRKLNTSIQTTGVSEENLKKTLKK